MTCRLERYSRNKCSQPPVCLVDGAGCLPTNLLAAVALFALSIWRDGGSAGLTRCPEASKPHHWSPHLGSFHASFAARSF